jgi:excisionase family DNA binding protein
LEKLSSGLASNSILDKAVLTTKEAANLIGVSLPSIINWADSGQFVSFRTPGGHRRIRTKDFIEFAREKGYPLPQKSNQPEVNSNKHHLLIIDHDVDYAEAVQDFLELDDKNDVEVCSNSFWAGLNMAKTHITTLIIDQETMMLQDTFEKNLSKYLPNRKIKVIVLSKLFSSGKSELYQGRLLVSKSNSIREVVELILNYIKS